MFPGSQNIVQGQKILYSAQIIAKREIRYYSKIIFMNTIGSIYTSFIVDGKQTAITDVIDFELP
jgi:purine nucleoside phosphorylase